MKISSEDHLGLRGAALARAIVRSEAEEGGGDGRGGEGQLDSKISGDAIAFLMFFFVFHFESTRHPERAHFNLVAW